jgi:hypothetical protein
MIDDAGACYGQKLGSIRFFERVDRLPPMKTSELGSLLPTNWVKPQPADKA